MTRILLTFNPTEKPIIVTYKNLKIMANFFFAHHTNSVKLSKCLWPRMAKMKMGHNLKLNKCSANVFNFCACILQKSFKTYYGLLSLAKS